MTFSVIILAAGQGKRMNSLQPKVLQLLAGRPLVHHVLDTVKALNPEQVLMVCGYKGEVLQQNCADYAVDWVWQVEQLGTGHAVRIAYPELVGHERVLVLYGDVPLISEESLAGLLRDTPEGAVGLLTARLAEPYGFGRIVRNAAGEVENIIEERDASEEQRKITEINPGIYVLPYKYLATWLSNLSSHNDQSEYYLTDVVAMAVAAGVPIVTHEVADALEIMGVNSQLQLHDLERAYQERCARRLLQRGVKLYDCARIDVRGELSVGSDVVIDVGVVFEGKVELGNDVVIGPHVVLKDCVVADGVQIYAHSVIDGAVIGAKCKVGPFARLRPGTVMHDGSKVGNFVETKNVQIGISSKINHLSYIGDAFIGKNVNIGAGVITCNYDGVQKHKTVIEDDAFIGSNCELIAPVTVGRGATLGAGTTLMKDAPAGALTLTKKILSSVIGWARPVKSKEGI